LNEEFISALLRHFRRDGERAIARMAAAQPAAYCKILTLLVPREHKLEHANAITSLSDEQLETMIEHIQERLERRAAAAKTIDGELVAPALPPPADTTSSGGIFHPTRTSLFTHSRRRPEYFRRRCPLQIWRTESSSSSLLGVGMPMFRRATGLCRRQD